MEQNTKLKNFFPQLGWKDYWTGNKICVLALDFPLITYEALVNLLLDIPQSPGLYKVGGRTR